LLEESEEAAPGWVAALLAALVPPASPERGRVAAAVLQRAEQLLAPPVQARVCVHAQLVAHLMRTLLCLR
jgi:hypothetical protein